MFCYLYEFATNTKYTFQFIPPTIKQYLFIKAASFLRLLRGKLGSETIDYKFKQQIRSKNEIQISNETGAAESADFPCCRFDNLKNCQGLYDSIEAVDHFGIFVREDCSISTDSIYFRKILKPKYEWVPTFHDLLNQTQNSFQTFNPI